MAITRWNPWGELFTLADTMDQVFGRTLTPERATATLPLDVRQSDDAYFIEASVPGFSPDEVEITLDENVLTIRAHHDQEKDEGRGGYVRRERRSTSFFRQVGLPAEVRPEEISASFDNGILTVTVPRAQKAQPRRIAVSAGAPAEPKVIEASSQTSG